MKITSFQLTIQQDVDEQGYGEISTSVLMIKA